jgi:hypothetical protein
MLRHGAGKIPRFARNDNLSETGLQQFSASRTETPDAGRETFFDSEFLKKLERLHLIAKRLSWAGAKGEHAASRKGFSLEFSDYRRYQRGDDLRYVDWNVYRRLERLLVKVFTAEEEMNIYLLVDTSRSMAEGQPAKLDYAKKVAAALGYIGLKNLDRVGGASFSTRLQSPLTLGRGRKQILRLFTHLDKLVCHGDTNVRAAVHTFTNLFPHPVCRDQRPVRPRFGARRGLRPSAAGAGGSHRRTAEIGQGMGDVASWWKAGATEIFLDDTPVRLHRAELANYFKDIETVCAAREIDFARRLSTIR